MFFIAPTSRQHDQLAEIFAGYVYKRLNGWVEFWRETSTDFRWQRNEAPFLTQGAVRSLLDKDRKISFTSYYAVEAILADRANGYMVEEFWNAVSITEKAAVIDTASALGPEYMLFTSPLAQSQNAWNDNWDSQKFDKDLTSLLSAASWCDAPFAAIFRALTDQRVFGRQKAATDKIFTAILSAHNSTPNDSNDDVIYKIFSVIFDRYGWDRTQFLLDNTASWLEQLTSASLTELLTHERSGLNNKAIPLINCWTSNDNKLAVDFFLNKLDTNMRLILADKIAEHYPAFHKYIITMQSDLWRNAVEELYVPPRQLQIFIPGDEINVLSGDIVVNPNDIQRPSADGPRS